MNNEEKNIPNENEGVEVQNTPAEQGGSKKLSGGVIAGIIGGAVALIVAIVLMIVLIPGADSGNDNQDTPGTNDNNTDTKTNYIVTVVDEEGNAIPGATVSFNLKGSASLTFNTDAEGKASYKTAKEITVTITAIPAGYEYDKLNVAQNIDGDLTVTLTKLAPYYIKVVDEDGNAISGVTVQMCDEAGSCRLPRTTDENGVASYPYENGTFHAQLTSVPNGYTVDDPGAYYNFEDGTAIIILTKIAE